jgi:hypothetical protein
VSFRTITANASGVRVTVSSTPFPARRSFYWADASPGASAIAAAIAGNSLVMASLLRCNGAAHCRPRAGTARTKEGVRSP